MKWKWLLLVLSALSLSLGLGRSAYGQGTLVFNNLGPSDGKVFLRDAFGTKSPLNQDVNFSLELVNGNSTLTLVRSWLLRDGSATGINVGPGLFSDPTHSIIVLPEFVPGAAINVRVNAWAGDYPTWGDAVSGGLPGAVSQLFSVRLGSVEAPPESLVGFPGFEVPVLPEPRIVKIAMIGAVLFLFGSARGRSKANAS